MDSMLGYSFDGTVTANCPILVMEKMKTIKKLPEASSCILLIITEMQMILKYIS